MRKFSVSGRALSFFMHADPAQYCTRRGLAFATRQVFPLRVILSGRDHKLIATVVRMSRRHVRLVPWAAEPCGPAPMFLVQHAQYKLLSGGVKPAMDLPTTYPIAPRDRNGNGHPLRSMNLYKQVVLLVWA